MIQRVDLGNGKWWDINTAPKWGTLRNLDQQQGDAALLAAVTAAWSFEEPVSPEEVNNREAPDVLAALEVVFDKILPLFEHLTKMTQKNSIRPSGTGA